MSYSVGMDSITNSAVHSLHFIMRGPGLLRSSVSSVELICPG